MTHTIRKAVQSPTMPPFDIHSLVDFPPLPSLAATKAEATTFDDDPPHDHNGNDDRATHAEAVAVSPAQPTSPHQEHPLPTPAVEGDGQVRQDSSSSDSDPEDNSSTPDEQDYPPNAAEIKDTTPPPFACDTEDTKDTSSNTEDTSSIRDEQNHPPDAAQIKDSTPPPAASKLFSTSLPPSWPANFAPIWDLICQLRRQYANPSISATTMLTPVLRSAIALTSQLNRTHPSSAVFDIVVRHVLGEVEALNSSMLEECNKLQEERQFGTERWTLEQEEYRRAMFGRVNEWIREWRVEHDGDEGGEANDEGFNNGGSDIEGSHIEDSGPDGSVSSVASGAGELLHAMDDDELMCPLQQSKVLAEINQIVQETQKALEAADAARNWSKWWMVLVGIAIVCLLPMRVTFSNF